MSRRAVTPPHIGPAAYRVFYTFQVEVDELSKAWRPQHPPQMPLDWDARDCRAAELLWAGPQFRSMARCVFECGIYGKRRCRSRLCPTCGPQQAQRYAVKVKHAVDHMNRPTLTLITLRSRNLEDLGDAINDLRRGLGHLKRRRGVKQIANGGWVGTLEPKLAVCGRFWALHIHFFVDMDPEDIGVLTAAWQTESCGRGVFELSTHPEVRRDKTWCATNYAVKPVDWCPNPSSMSLKAFRGLAVGLYRRQLTVRWRVRWAS